MVFCKQHIPLEGYIKQIYTDLGQLIKAIGTSWFGNTLPAVLQCGFDYDYFLLVRYRPERPLQIVRSDFPDIEMQKPLHYLATETYVAEPIFRLFNAGKTSGGVFNMVDLTRKSLALSDPIDYSLPHLIKDAREEIGWRTKGWPEYQQETCILIPIGGHQLVAVSLYSFGLTSSGLSNRDTLETIYPIVAAAISRHFELQEAAEIVDEAVSTDLLGEALPESPVGHDTVMGFFQDAFKVEITNREAEIFTPLLQGDTLAAIADKLCISVHTARTHRRNVYRKIGHGRLLELINQFHATAIRNAGCVRH